MKALILAAGLGRRLKIDKPKILLKIRNKTLLERHLVNLINFGVSNIGIVIGYKSNQLKKFLAKKRFKQKIKIFENTNYNLGSTISLVSAKKFFNEKGDLFLMDGDVLYDKKILKKLINSKKKDCLLIDKNFETGKEPVKVCVKNNKILDFGKTVKKPFDFQGESVGFFKFRKKTSMKILNEGRSDIKKNKNSMYEDIIQKLIKTKKITMNFEKVNKLSWIEIDFKKDLIKARKKIINQINE